MSIAIYKKKRVLHLIYQCMISNCLVVVVEVEDIVLKDGLEIAHFVLMKSKFEVKIQDEYQHLNLKKMFKIVIWRIT